MKEYPMALEEFEKKFNTEEACRDYLFNLRWPNGFECPKCGNNKAWPIGNVLFECSKCSHQTSVTAGTIFSNTHKPLTVWFGAICTTRQVSAKRIEDYIFKNLKRISRDKHYVDSLIFRLNYDSSGNRIGFEPSKKLPYSSNISPESFMQTLKNFTEILPEKKGIDKSLWVKKFIKRIDYSKEEIALLLYYKGIEGAEYGIYASGRAEESAGGNSKLIDSEKELGTFVFGSNNGVWLCFLAEVRTFFEENPQADF